jgi:inner membrane protein
MDSLTQIVLGAAVGEAILGKKIGNKAILWGAIAGTIPDLDVFVRFLVDPLRATEMHRILCWLASKIHRKEGLDWKPWTKLMFGSIVTHPLLDAHTNWGTQLFWPLDYKVAYKNIFIIDPLYTIPFLIFVIIAMSYKRDDPKRKRINHLGLIISTTYMVFTIVCKGIGYQHFVSSLRNQQIEYSEIETNPTPFNCILWIATVETKENYLVGYYSLLDGGKEVEFTKFRKNHELLGGMGQEDITKRLIKLSEGWYVIVKNGDKTYFNDMRFGQMGMSDDPDSFVFSHELWYENGELKVQQRQKSMEGMGSVFKDLMKRVGGK